MVESLARRCRSRGRDLLVLVMLGLSFWLGYLARPWSGSGAWVTPDGVDGVVRSPGERNDPPAKPIDLADLEIWTASARPVTSRSSGGSRGYFLEAVRRGYFNHGEIASEPRKARVYSLEPGKRPYEVLRTTVRPAWRRVGTDAPRLPPLAIGSDRSTPTMRRSLIVSRREAVMADPIDSRMLASHRLGDDTVEPTLGTRRARRSRPARCR